MLPALPLSILCHTRIYNANNPIHLPVHSTKTERKSEKKPPSRQNRMRTFAPKEPKQNKNCLPPIKAKAKKSTSLHLYNVKLMALNLLWIVHCTFVRPFISFSSLRSFSFVDAYRVISPKRVVIQFFLSIRWRLSFFSCKICVCIIADCH